MPADAVPSFLARAAHARPVVAMATAAAA
jgi:hypothetical protein